MHVYKITTKNVILDGFACILMVLGEIASKHTKSVVLHGFACIFMVLPGIASKHTKNVVLHGFAFIFMLFGWNCMETQEKRRFAFFFMVLPQEHICERKFCEGVILFEIEEGRSKIGYFNREMPIQALFIDFFQ